MIRLLSILFIATLAGCSGEADSQVSGGNFTVHFSNPEDKELAEKLVHFWKDEGLMTDKDQDIKIVRKKGGYDLYMISESRKSHEELSFDEIKSLTMLRERLKKKVFTEKDVRLVITDNSFKPVFTPNI